MAYMRANSWATYAGTQSWPNLQGSVIIEAMGVVPEGLVSCVVGAWIDSLWHFKQRIHFIIRINFQIGDNYLGC